MPAMWQVAVDTAVMPHNPVLSAVVRVRTPMVVPSHSHASPMRVVAVAGAAVEIDPLTSLPGLIS